MYRQQLGRVVLGQWMLGGQGPRTLSLSIRIVADSLTPGKFASSSDYSRPSSGQPVPGTGPEIFDDVPETVNEDNNPLGTDIVPVYS